MSQALADGKRKMSEKPLTRSFGTVNIAEVVSLHMRAPRNPQSFWDGKDNIYDVQGYFRGIPQTIVEVGTEDAWWGLQPTRIRTSSGLVRPHMGSSQN